MMFNFVGAVSRSMNKISVRSSPQPSRTVRHRGNGIRRASQIGEYLDTRLSSERHSLRRQA